MSGRESLFALGEIRRELETPEDVHIALHRTEPQALLRDLHRPVTKFSLGPLDFVSEPKIGAFVEGDATAENRRDILADRRVPIQDLLHTGLDMLAEYKALRELIVRPWTDAPKFGHLKLHL